MLTEDIGRAWRNPEYQYRLAHLCIDSRTRLICIGDGVDTADPNWQPILSAAVMRHGMTVPETRRYDIAFLQGLSATLHRQEAAIPDLLALTERQRRLWFPAQGELHPWVDRLAPLGCRDGVAGVEWPGSTLSATRRGGHSPPVFR